MEEFDRGVLLGVFFGLFVGILLSGLFATNGIGNEVSELGQAICDQEYDMDFQSYNNKELKCKTREIKNQTVYDGIVVEVG